MSVWFELTKLQFDLNLIAERAQKREYTRLQIKETTVTSVRGSPQWESVEIIL